MLHFVRNSFGCENMGYGRSMIGYEVLSLYSLSDKTSYCKIPRILEAARLSAEMIVSFWNLKGPGSTMGLVFGLLTR